MLFENTISPPDLRRPREVAVGDINADGHDDVVMADRTARSVFLFLGDGTGKFTNIIEIELLKEQGRDGQAYGIALGNFDFVLDDDMDIAVTDRSADEVVLLLNDGQLFPTFESLTFPVGTNPEDIVAADFNVDGNLDFAVLNSGRPIIRDMTVYLFERVPTGTTIPIFRRAGDVVLGRSPSNLTIGDFDGDGIEDVAYLEKPGIAQPVEVDFLFSRPDFVGGFFFEPADPPFIMECPSGNRECNGTALAAAELDNEGFVDLVTATVSTGSNFRDISFIVGRGGGFFDRQQFFIVDGARVDDIVVGKFNTGPFDDVVISQRSQFLKQFINVSGLDNGEPCSDEEQCKSGFCIEGVCCNRQCDDGETCVAPESLGFCKAFTPTPTRTPAPGTPRPPGEPCLEDADCEPGLFCTDGVCCYSPECPPDFFCYGFQHGIDDPAAIPGVCFPGTPPPTQIPNPTNTRARPTIHSSSGGGGCSIDGTPPANGGSALLMILLLPAALWVGRRWQV